MQTNHDQVSCLLIGPFLVCHHWLDEFHKLQHKEDQKHLKLTDKPKQLNMSVQTVLKTHAGCCSSEKRLCRWCRFHCNNSTKYYIYPRSITFICWWNITTFTGKILQLPDYTSKTSPGFTLGSRSYSSLCFSILHWFHFFVVVVLAFYSVPDNGFQFSIAGDFNVCKKWILWQSWQQQGLPRPVQSQIWVSIWNIIWFLWEALLVHRTISYLYPRYWQVKSDRWEFQVSAHTVSREEATLIWRRLEPFTCNTTETHSHNNLFYVFKVHRTQEQFKLSSQSLR